jgi:hypothetical protein
LFGFWLHGFLTGRRRGYDEVLHLLEQQHIDLAEIERRAAERYLDS